MKLCIMYEHRHNLQSYKLQPNIFAYLSLLQTSSFKDILYFLQTPSSSLTYGWNHKSRGKRATSFQVSFSLSLSASFQEQRTSDVQKIATGISKESRSGGRGWLIHEGSFTAAKFAALKQFVVLFIAASRAPGPTSLDRDKIISQTKPRCRGNVSPLSIPLCLSLFPSAILPMPRCQYDGRKIKVEFVPEGSQKRRQVGWIHCENSIRVVFRFPPSFLQSIPPSFVFRSFALCLYCPRDKEIGFGNHFVSGSIISGMRQCGFFEGRERRKIILSICRSVSVQRITMFEES